MQQLRFLGLRATTDANTLLNSNEIEPHKVLKEFAAVSVPALEIKDICSEI